jgi:hypothetical protein
MIDHPKIRIAYIKPGAVTSCFWRVFYPPTSCHARAVLLVPAFHPVPRPWRPYYMTQLSVVYVVFLA